MNHGPTAVATLYALTMTFALTSCTSATRPTGDRGDSTTPTTTAETPEPDQGNGTALGRPGCRPPSPIAAGGMGAEVQGTGHGATLYGLIQSAAPLPVRTGQQVKIVWRMTGSGPLRLSATSPQGKPAALQWGPEIHGGSNYDRPGHEWGAGYLFPTAGCWHLHAQRSNASADVWLRVATR
jgi:hypothetical protein